MLSYHQAREQILDAVAALPAEDVALLDAAGRAIAEDMMAPLPLPAFDNSAMDGYAVRAADCTAGKTLPVVGYLPAGGADRCRVAPGTAVKIMTGAPIPPGADAVVPFEDTEESPQHITLRGEVKQGEHIRWQGEDISPGDLILEKGTVLRPAEISLLASMDCSTVKVGGKVRVAILSTGDELRELGESGTSESIVNSNSWALAAAVREIGGEPVMLGIARDSRESLFERMSQGLQADVLLTSAGVSAGDRDYVRDVLEDLGVDQKFWKINIKPGKPTAFGLKGRVAIFALPGNPVSAMMTFEEFVRPALLKMMGHRTLVKPLYRARLRHPLTKKPGRLQMLRVAVSLDADGRLEVLSAGDQNTGILKTLLNAQGIALLPAERDHFEAGEEIELHLLGAATGLGC